MTFFLPLGMHRSIHSLLPCGVRITVGQRVHACAAPGPGCQGTHRLSFAWDLTNFSQDSLGTYLATSPSIGLSALALDGLRSD